MAPELVELARWALIVVFAVALAHKVSGPRDFRRATGALLGVAGRPAGVLASFAAVTEAVVLGLLLVRTGAPWGFGIAVVLLAAYTGAIARALGRPGAVGCACFDSTSKVRPADLVRNGVLVGLAGTGALGTRLGTAPPDVAGAWAVAVVGGLVVGIALTQVSRVMALVDGKDGGSTWGG